MFLTNEHLYGFDFLQNPTRREMMMKGKMMKMMKQMKQRKQERRMIDLTTSGSVKLCSVMRHHPSVLIIFSPL